MKSTLIQLGFTNQAIVCGASKVIDVSVGFNKIIVLNSKILFKKAKCKLIKTKLENVSKYK